MLAFRSLLAYTCLCTLVYATRLPSQVHLGVSPETPPQCPQVEPLFPKKHHDLDVALETRYGTDAFKDSLAASLSAIVQVPTESYDDMEPVGKDPRWTIFGELHSKLEELFPRVYKSLRVTKVNTYALAFHWQGSSENLKPLLLAAHQDVVPVEPSTISQWEHPPYSGYYDGTWIWGRGTCDDKSDLNSLLTTVENLLTNGFTPKRTIVLSFGIDEESAGVQGAGHLAKYLEKTYGRDSFAAILDEGGYFGAFYGGDTIFAIPNTGEKGSLDVRLEVSAPGGHSSVPPAHTTIGMLAAAITELEANPHETSLWRTDTVFQETQCLAAYGPNVPDDVRALAKLALYDDDALKDLEQTLIAWTPFSAAQLGTTQAVDLISGGVKVNALPETAYAVINHRIAEHSSVDELKQRLARVLHPVAKRFDLSLDAFGRNVSAGTGAGGHLELGVAWDSGLEPAPVTPTGDSAPFVLLSGTIQATARQTPRYENQTFIVKPTLALGNTDTQFYWNLTRHIFRYSHMGEDGIYNGMHTINEAIKAESLVDKIRFHTKFILNWDEADI